MSVETAPRPTAETTPDSATSDWDVIDQELDFDSPEVPDVDSGSDGSTDSDNSSPEQAEQYKVDERQLDRQILGKSVRLRENVRDKASKAVSNTDTLWAHIKNVPGSPRKLFRKALTSNAKRRLENKEQRLSDKKDARQNRYDSKKQKLEGKLEGKRQDAQAKVDATSSARLQRIRQSKLDKQHAKRELKVKNKLDKLEAKHTRKNDAHKAKVDGYRTSVFDERQNRFNETVKVHSDRLKDASDRRTEREKSIDKARKDALENRELAKARKALRKSLRKEHGASLRETRAALTEIFGDGDEAVAKKTLSVLGRKIVESGIAGKAYNKSQKYVESSKRDIERTAAKKAKAEQDLSRLPDIIADLVDGIMESDEVTASRLKAVADLEQQWDERRSSQDMISINEGNEHQSLLIEAKEAARQAVEDSKQLQRKYEHARERLVALPGEISELEQQQANQEEVLRKQQAEATARANVAGTAGNEARQSVASILGETEQRN